MGFTIIYQSFDDATSLYCWRSRRARVAVAACGGISTRTQRTLGVFDLLLPGPIRRSFVGGGGFSGSPSYTIHTGIGCLCSIHHYPICSQLIPI